MAHLFWTFLNLGLYLFFLVICFRATKLVRQKMGLFAVIVFVFGLFSFVQSGRKQASVPNSQQGRTIGVQPRSKTTPNSYHRTHGTVDKNWAFSIELAIETGTDTSSRKMVPTEATAYLLGATGGFSWEPIATVVSATDDQNLAYDITGVMHWKLFGTTLYAEPKHYSGTLAIL